MDTWDNIASVLNDFWTGLRLTFTEPPAMYVAWSAVAAVAALVWFLVWWNHR